MSTSHRLVLFDLDGTLIDSAPDLAGAANAMRVARGLEAMPLDALRPMVGAGARGMVGLALGVEIAMVATHHLFRLFLIIITGPIVFRTILRRGRH